MTMPSITKTYQFSKGIYGAGLTLIDDSKAFQLGLKNALIGFASSPWTVSGSSNSVAAGIDGYDRWLTASNLVWANSGIAHSWIVLRQTGILSTFELCIDLNYSSGNHVASIVVSPNAFTGGSITARPTATNERVLISTTAFLQTANSFPNGLAVMQSTDGYVTRIITMSKDGWIAPYLSFEVPKNPVSGWTSPWLATCYTNISGVSNTSAGFSATARYVGRVGTTDFTAFLGGEGFNGTLLHKLNRANSYTQQYPILPISVISETGGARGRIGELMDAWWITPSNNDITAISLWPDGTSRAYIQLGEMLFPWDGSWPNIYPT